MARGRALFLSAASGLLQWCHDFDRVLAASWLARRRCLLHVQAVVRRGQKQDRRGQKQDRSVRARYKQHLRDPHDWPSLVTHFGQRSGVGSGWYLKRPGRVKRNLNEERWQECEMPWKLPPSGPITAVPECEITKAEEEKQVKLQPLPPPDYPPPGWCTKASAKAFMTPRSVENPQQSLGSATFD